MADTPVRTLPCLPKGFPLLARGRVRHAKLMGGCPPVGRQTDVAGRLRTNRRSGDTFRRPLDGGVPVGHELAPIPPPRRARHGQAATPRRETPSKQERPFTARPLAVVVSVAGSTVGRVLSSPFLAGQARREAPLFVGERPTAGRRHAPSAWGMDTPLATV